MTFHQNVSCEILEVIVPKTIFGMMKNCNSMNTSSIVRCHCIRNTIFSITAFPPVN
jgi:hypothetical protein